LLVLAQRLVEGAGTVELPHRVSVELVGELLVATPRRVAPPVDVVVLQFAAPAHCLIEVLVGFNPGSGGLTLELRVREPLRLEPRLRLALGSERVEVVVDVDWRWWRGGHGRARLGVVNE